ncbi:hypothetical protein XH97_34435 [Bradyrhizobium sp. CCBAU 53380]|nr:hypothetical protein [Bradyrhizobium sp. CCBAU 53380]
MQQLLDEIAIERPQVKKLLEEIGSDALLVVTTVFTPPPKKFAFVQSVVLLTEDGPRTIIEIDEAVAAELHGNVAGMERRIAANQALNRAVRQFDSDDYAMAKRPRAREQVGIPPVEFYFRRYVEDDAALTTELVKLFQSSDTYDAFVGSVRDLIKANELTIEGLSVNPITSPIKTFTGEENTVPQYAKQLLGRLRATTSRPLYPTKLRNARPTTEGEMKDAAKKMLEDVKLDIDSAISGLDQLCDEASKMVDADWSRRRLEIVPGSAILDEVYKKFGARYDKVRDGIGVASQMRREELDSEIRDFIRKLDPQRSSGF